MDRIYKFLISLVSVPTLLLILCCVTFLISLILCCVGFYICILPIRVLINPNIINDKKKIIWNLEDII